MGQSFCVFNSHVGYKSDGMRANALSIAIFLADFFPMGKLEQWQTLIDQSKRTTHRKFFSTQTHLVLGIDTRDL